MEDESLQKQGIQVIFLIDTLQFYENRENENALNKAFRAISTSILRVLTYFVNRQDCDRSKFAWGFQFFRIPLKTHFYSKRSIFREFTPSSFNDFEKQLEEEIGLNSVTGIAKSKSKHKQKATGFEVSPAFSLKYALHDACLEYRWDELIISSPHKTSKLRRMRSGVKNDGNNQQQTRFVFVLLPCPLSLSDLETFCEHKSSFSTSYLKRTLIHTGKQESHLFDTLKASLMWLDTGNLWELKQQLTFEKAEQELGDLRRSLHRNDEVPIANTDGLDLLNDTLALLRGRVVPLQCLVNLEGYEVPAIGHLLETAVSEPPSKEAGGGTDKSSEKQKDEPCSSQDWSHSTLLYSSALDHYTKNNYTISGNTSLTHFAVFDNPEDKEVKEMNIELYGSHDKTADPLCSLNIQLMWNCQNSAQEKATSGDGNHDDKEDDDVETCSSDIPFTIPDSLTLPKVTGRDAIDSSDNDSLVRVLGSIFEEEEDMEEDSKEETAKENIVDDSRAVILAAISKESLTLDVYQANVVYSCVGYEVSLQSAGADKDRAGSVTSEWFLRMLDQLWHSKCLLVLHLCSQLAVLEPLTPVLASLRVIHPEAMTHVESVVGKDESALASLRAHLSGNPSEISKKVDKNPRGECQLDLNIHKETNSLKPFQLSCLEPWYRDLPQCGVTAKFLEQLVSLPENLLLDESINLSSALSQLKELYKSEQNIPASQEKEREDTEEKKENPVLAAKQTKHKNKPIMRQQFQSRTLSIFDKSIQKVEKEVPEGLPKPKNNATKESTAVFVPDKEFSSTADLQAYVEESYDSAVSSTDNLLSSAQRIVSMTIHFTKEREKDHDKEEISRSAESFLRGLIYKSSMDLIKKYQNTQLENPQELRVRESKLQSLLRFEMELVSPMEVKVGDSEVKGQKPGNEGEEGQTLDSSADEGESELPEAVQVTVDEISQLLCSIPILADHEQLSSFLEDVVVPSYGDAIPYLVKAVYEELGHPIPKQLKSPSSSKPSVRAPSSYKAVKSWGSVDTVTAASTRSRSLSRHPSLADIGHKRVINIPPKRAKTPRRAKTKKLTSKIEETDKEARRAKRNLFSDGPKFPRRESVALMEGISQSRRQSPRKHSQGIVGERAPKVLKTRTVKETPGKRQVSQSLLLNVNRARKLEERLLGKALSPMVEVIEESPVKPEFSSVPRSFPKHMTRRPSFYSQNQLKDARRLTARITGASSGEVTDIAKTVEQKKSPARLLLKDVCTPSTLGSLSRLTRSSKVSQSIKASPELKPKLDPGQSAHEPKKDGDDRQRVISQVRQTRSMEKKERLNQVSDGDQNDAREKTECRRQDDDFKGTEEPEMTSASSEGKSLPEKKEQTPRKRTSVRTSLKKMFDGAVQGETGDVVHPAIAPETKSRKRKLGRESPPTSTNVSDEIVDDDIEEQTATLVKPEVAKEETSKGIKCTHESPSKKRKRTSAEKIRQGQGSERNARDCSPIGQEVATEDACEETTSNHKSPSKKKRKVGAEKIFQRRTAEKDSDVVGTQIHREAVTEEVSEETAGPHKSPSKKKGRNSGEKVPKRRGMKRNLSGGTPSPRRRASELASPDIFKQWPQRKLRSTPSPKGHFLRGQMAKKIDPTISDSPTELLGNPLKSVGRTLKQKSKTRLKFSGRDSSLKDSGTLDRNDQDGCQKPTPDGEQSRKLLPKRNSSEEQLERHFSFNSDDDEIEFIKINRTLSYDSLGRELSPAGNLSGKDPNASPIFNDSVNSSNSSPFKSLWRSPCESSFKTKTPKESGSPVFNYVSTPSSAGLKLTFTRQSSPLPREGVDMSSTSTATDPTGSSADEGTASKSVSSIVSSENDEVFASLCLSDTKPRTVTTPPGSAGKVTTKLSTKGLFDLLHSPFTGSPRHREKSLSTNRRKSKNADK